MINKITFLFVFIIGTLNAQETDTLSFGLPKKEQKKMEFAGVFKSAINIELGGKTGFVGVSYDLLLSKHFKVGAGVGFPAIGADLKYYPFSIKRDRIRLNIGIRSTAFFPLNATDYIFYSLPIGISYFAPNRLNFDFDIGPLMRKTIGNGQIHSGYGTKINYVWFSFKLGYRFSFYAIKRNKRLNKE